MKDQARDRLRRIFSYIRELTRLRTPPVSESSSYPWTLAFSRLPEHPTIQPGKYPGNPDEWDGVILRVVRPTETKCPTLPPELKEWVKSGWEQLIPDVSKVTSRNLVDSNGQTRTETFEADPKRVDALISWLGKRASWLEAEKPVRDASLVFSNLFDLLGRMKRESEKFQLYIGDGHLNWQSARGPINHPLLLQKVELEFNSNTPEFIIRETEDELEVYSELLRFHELDGSGIQEAKTKLTSLSPHPLGNEAASGFLKFIAQRFFENGQFFTSREKAEDCVDPYICRDPVLFLGNRTQSFVEALDKLIDAIPKMETLPDALYRIAGFEASQAESNNGAATGAGTSTPISSNEVDYLLTKPANKEQERIINRLESSGSVLVQGPPGTGKSHTIANIIGHLLANGKTVLIASHTSKALRVVREKVEKPIRPLCVSVLENDLESKAQLAESINGIVGYLSRHDSTSLTREIDQLKDRREHLKQQAAQLQSETLHIRKQEYTDIILGGQGIPPSEAARRVRDAGDKLDLIPGSIHSSAPFPLSSDELAELYASNLRLNTDEEQCIVEELVKPEALLLPSRFSELVESFNNLDLKAIEQFHAYWSGPTTDISVLTTALTELRESVTVLNTHSWAAAILEAGRLGPENIQHWENLVEQIESTVKLISQKSELIFKYGPKLCVPVTAQILKDLRDIVGHLRNGKSLGFFSKLMNNNWKKLLGQCEVDSGPPKSLIHFESLLALAEIETLRTEIKNRWERQVVSAGAKSLPEDKPEVQAKLHLEVIISMISWHKEGWRRIESHVQSQGFNIQDALRKMRHAKQSQSHVHELRSLISEILIPAIEGRMMWLKQEELKADKELILAELAMHDAKSYSNKYYLYDLAESIRRNDARAYEQAFTALLKLHSKAALCNRRLTLISKLEDVASAWYQALSAREGRHGHSTPPDEIETVWSLKQLEQALLTKHSLDYAKVQRELDHVRAELQSVSASYVEKLAWRYQIARTGLAERQALTGWQQLQGKLTKSGKGKLDAVRKREAKKLLSACKAAVPVWVMPLSKVFESFDLTTTKFDVIILDEASQSDVVALVAFAIAKQIIVVGDSEQVTPQAVGQELLKIQGLIDELLHEVPNRMLYDGKTSVYDLAEQSFGETIRLVEHFRCVPNIIQFSNLLSYNGEIKPLRESASSPYEEHVVAHRIQGGTTLNKVNKAEAYEVASIVASMTESKEYGDKSVGVISLLGQEQAIFIDSILQRHLRPETYQGHSILCGNASQFQGDERNIIILSMVDTCDDPPLRIRQTEDFKKSFNVAASRAKDQLWVVHSLNPSTDLKPGDLRLRLIQHAEDPNSIVKAFERASFHAESPFERLVMADLINAGYRLTPQWEVGAYRIDIVVEGTKKRIAVECDGDRYHPPEKLADDLQRQMVLERLGWRFVRLRGSEYFRDPKKTMNRVFGELDEFGIEKLGPAADAPKNQSGPSELRRRILELALRIKTEWAEKDQASVEVARAPSTVWYRNSSRYHCE